MCHTSTCGPLRVLAPGRAQIQVLKNSGSQVVKLRITTLCQRKIATDEIQEKNIIVNAAIRKSACQCIDWLSTAQNG